MRGLKKKKNTCDIRTSDFSALLLKKSYLKRSIFKSKQLLFVVSPSLDPNYIKGGKWLFICHYTAQGCMTKRKFVVPSSYTKFILKHGNEKNDSCLYKHLILIYKRVVLIPL